MKLRELIFGNEVREDKSHLIGTWEYLYDQPYQRLFYRQVDVGLYAYFGVIYYGLEEEWEPEENVEVIMAGSLNTQGVLELRRRAVTPEPILYNEITFLNLLRALEYFLEDMN